MKKIMSISCCLAMGLFISLLTMPEAWANNLTISSVTLDHALYDVDPNVKGYYIDLDLSIYNSWRDTDAPSVTANWDAAWLFAKYSVWNDSTEAWTDWAHCTLSKTDANHTIPGNAELDVGCSPNQDCTDEDNTGVGAFIYRKDADSGSTFDVPGIKLHWDYSADGNADLIDANFVRLKVFGVEMVYIPEGPFFVGDPDCDKTHGPSGCFYKYGCDTTVPENCSFEITSDATIPAGATAGKLYAKGDPKPSSDIPASYPVGFNSFYLMKYELTQAQYRDFLNTLTRTQQEANTVSHAENKYAMTNGAAVINGQTIRNPSLINETDVIIFGCDGDGDGDFDKATDGEWRAMNYLSAENALAYAAWAGLRPGTEFEFIKAARGPKPAVAGEYAWGTTTFTTASGIANAQTSSESVSSGNAMLPATGSYQYPLRVGIFAQLASTKQSTREQAGAGYYGNMELSGNLWDAFFGVTHTGFKANHGQGMLSSPSDWGYSLYLGFGAGWSSLSVVAARSNTSIGGSASGARFARTTP